MPDREQFDKLQICGLCGKRKGTEYDFFFGQYMGMTGFNQSEATGIRTTSWTDHYANMRRGSHFICDQCFKEKAWQEYFLAKDPDNTNMPIPRTSLLFALAAVASLLIFLLVPRSITIMNVVLGLVGFFTLVMLVFILIGLFRLVFARQLGFGNELAIDVEKQRNKNISDNTVFLTPKAYKTLRPG